MPLPSQTMPFVMRTHGLTSVCHHLPAGSWWSAFCRKSYTSQFLISYIQALDCKIGVTSSLQYGAKVFSQFGCIHLQTPINTTGEFLLLKETSLVPLFQLFVVLIFTSLIDKEVVHLFKCLLAIFLAIL